jgi:DNA-binding response OmpR family regulator
MPVKFQLRGTGLRAAKGEQVASATRFGLLGPMTVTVSDIAVGLARAKERILLAALLLNANQAVPISELAEAVWGIDAPRSAVGTQRGRASPSSPGIHRGR